MDGELIDGWRLDQQRRGLMASSISQRTSQVRTFARWMDPASITTATEDEVQRFLDGRGIGARTRYTWLSTLGCFYQWAGRAGHVEANPTADIARPKLRQTLPRPISDDDLEMAIRLADGQMSVWLLLASYSGLRCAEIAGLHRDDVLWDMDRLRVVGKGDKERLVPMHPRVRDALAVYPMPRQNRPIFTRPGGGRWPDALVSRAGSVYLHSIGIDATMHQLRHWFGTRALRASGGNLRVVQGLMGHSSPTTTAIYTAFCDDDAAAAVVALGARPIHQPALWE